MDAFQMLLFLMNESILWENVVSVFRKALTRTICNILDQEEVVAGENIMFPAD